MVLAKLPKFFIRGSVAFLFLVALSLFVLGGIAFAYRNSFYPGIAVAGTTLTGTSKVDGEKIIALKAQKYADHRIALVVPDISRPIPNSSGQYEHKELTASAGDLGLHFLTDDAGKDAWNIGHTKNIKEWVMGVIPTLFLKHDTSLGYVSDDAIMNKYIADHITPEVPTSIPAQIIIKDDTLGVSNSFDGYTIDQDALRQAISQSFAAASDADTTYLKAPGKITHSSITKELVQPVADRLNAIASAHIAMTSPGLRLTPTRAELLTWFVPTQTGDGGLSLVVQKDVLQKYLAGQKVLDQDKSVSAALTALTGLTTTKKVPTYFTITLINIPPKISSSGVTLGKFEGKYVEINLTTQRLYTVTGDTLVNAYPISSGKWSTPTPVGIFHINGKSLRAWSYPYGLWMPYWENFLNGEYGIHELPEWPGGQKEGANHLGIPVSDGCVRLGIGAAKEVYYWTEKGTPVYIHK